MSVRCEPGGAGASAPATAQRHGVMFEGHAACRELERGHAPGKIVLTP